MEWRVYILRCADGSLYTGITTDLERRLREHNGELPGGARYTRGRRPVRLLWRRSASNRSEACQLESRIKRMTRTQKLDLIRRPGNAGKSQR